MKKKHTIEPTNDIKMSSLMYGPRKQHNVDNPIKIKLKHLKCLSYTF